MSGARWTDDEIAELVRWYDAHSGEFLNLNALAMRIGRAVPNICRKARQLGLTDVHRKLPGPRAPGGGLSKARYATPEERKTAAVAKWKEHMAKHGHPRGARGLKHTPEHLAKMQEGARRWREAASREELDAVVDRAQKKKLEKYGTLNPAAFQTNPYSRCRHGRRPDLGNQFFRSRWEANYARYLNWLIERGTVARWEYEADTFWFEKIRRGVRSYTPDFKVYEPNGAVHYVEVKGWMDAKSKTKIKRMAKYHPAVDLRVVGEKAYREIERMVGGAIPGWETRHSVTLEREDAQEAA